MNKIYKVMYSKVKQCCVVVSEIAKSHGHNGESSGVRKHAALTAAVLLALGSLSFTTAFVPMTAEAADKTRTDGSNFVGVERTDGLFEDSDYANHNGQGAHGDDSITIGLKASGGDGTITIGDRRAEKSLGSVYVGRGPGMPTGKVLPSETDDGYWATSVGYQSDATGYGSIAIGSNATANNSYDKDSTGHGIDLKTKSGDGKSFVLKGKPDIQRASVAIGYGASADNGNIAIGSYSDASTDLRTAKTKDGKEIKSYLTDKMADSYVSVGDGKDHSETQYRRISNVADGASASDVATVGQLQALSDKVGVYDAGFGIEIASDKDNKTNTISLNRNLGTNYTDKAHHGDEKVTVAVDDTGLVLGGYAEDEKGNKKNPAVTYGATGDDSVTVGGMNSLASGRGSVVTGGVENIASGATAVAIGGNNNDAIGTRSAVLGGLDNTAFGSNSMVSGGSYNVAGGIQSAVLGGFSNYALGTGTTSIGGYGKDYETGYDSSVNGDYSVGVAGGSTGKDAKYALAAGHQAVVTTENGTAIGYQATTDKANTIAFGHDAGDVSGYTIEWNQLPENQVNADGTTNDYTKAPKSVTPTTYKDAYYNRLVKVADGIDDHDVVVMKQLKQYAEKDASNLGNNITVYKTDERGNVQLDGNKKPVEDTGATTTAQKNSKDAWGKALGAEPFTTGTSDAATNASTSDQLVTGKTLYDYDKPTDSQNYVKVNNTTGQNLSALDAQVKANADALTKPNHNIKYYAVDETTLPKLTNFNGKDYSNEKNNGAVGMGSIAAGFNTHADGIASTVAGSYSGVVGTGLQGAAALSYGTFNVNKNAAQAGTFSGVANSIVGQANVTTDSNAAIIYGAGNTVKNSYRDIDTKNASEIMAAAGSGDVTKLSEALQKAVPTSGGQVMVMGGGNSVENAYMTQVTGVGNTVTGSGEKYDKDSSTQLNYVDGFYTTLENGKNDYIIGSHNTVTGTSTDKNKSNIVFGDNHTLKNTKNNVILGSLDAVDETTVSDVVSIGHDAKVSAEGGVAIGSGSVVSENNIAGTIGYDPLGAEHKDDTTGTWKSTDGAVSVGGSSSDGKTITRQITNVAAGTNPTDVVNVAQLQNATEDLTNKGLKFKGDDNQEVTRKLNDTLTLKGGVTNTSDLSTAANIGVVKDGDGGLKIELAKNLTGLTSVTTGNTTIDNSGLTIKNATDATKNVVINSNNVSLGGNTITNMGSGLGKTYTEEGDNNSATIGDVKNLADARKTTVKSSDGTVTVTDKNTANADSHDYDLSVNYGKAASNLTLNYTGDNNTKGSNKLNESVAFNGTAGQIETKAANGKVTFKLADDMKTKTIMVTGENGNDGQIGLKGKDGKDGTVTTIIKTIGKNGTDGKPGVDGKDGITRIVYQDGKDGESGTTTHTVATLDDGLKFKGDDNQEVTRKLDETLTLKGGVTNTGDLSTAANIGVVKDGDGGLKIELAKNLTGLTSVTTGNTTIDNSGLTIKNATDATKNVVINSNNVSLGGNTITNMGSGLGKTYTEEGDNNSATIGDVKNLADARKTTVKSSDGTVTVTDKNTANADSHDYDLSVNYGKAASNLTLNYTGDNNTKGSNKLNESVAFNGTAGQIETKAANGKVTFKLADDMKTKTIMVTGENGNDGQIGLKGKDGKDGTVTTIIKTIGKNGTDGKPGVDGKDGITRIVYQDGKDGESGTTTHTVATLDDGLKFKGDDNQEVTRKLDETLTLKGGVTNTGDLSTAANIGVIKDGDGGLKIELAKNLTGLTSVTTGNTTIDNSGLTIKNATDATKNIVINSNNVSLGGNTITNMGSGADASGNYTNTANAANVGDVQNIVKKAVDAASDATNQALAGKANVDASNLTPDNVTKWQEKLGNGKVESGNTGLVTGDTVFKAVDTKANRDGSNLTDKEADSFSEKIARGEVKAGENRAVSGDAVSQAISKVTGDMNTKLDGKANTSLDNITDTGKNVIRDLAKGSVKVIDGTNTTVTTVEGKGETPTTYAVNVEGNGTIASGNTGLISGGTLYNEVHVDKDGTYIKSKDSATGKDMTVAQNLSALDTGLKTTSDLIHTNDKGDIQIGGSSKATKIDVHGKDAKGNTTGRFITGVVTDAGDNTSAANVGYVNGVTAANTQQIYRDMNNAYGRLNNNINKAAAGSNALAALHPLDYDPDDKADFAVGYGHYRNANAAAVGAFYHPNENTMVNVGVSLGNGDPGFNAGVSFKIGSGSAGREAMSKTEMAKVINSQSKEIDALKKDNADKDKRIDALEQKMAEILAKLDKNGK